MIGYDRILRIPFTASVRLRALLLKAGPGGQTPSKVSLVGPRLSLSAYIDYYMSSLQMQTVLISTMSSIRPPPRNSMSHKAEMLENMQSSEWFLFLQRNSHLGVSRAAKFSNLSSITLFIPVSQGAENTRIYYVGFLGSWTEVSQHAVYPIFRRFLSLFQHKNKPIITIYETQANLADHEKIQGLDGTSSAPGH